MTIENAQNALDKIIKKSRVHLYKPIQIAEILYRDRVKKDIDLAELETYRNISKKWRDVICQEFLGRISTSSSRYQDDVFNENAISPSALVLLGEKNRSENGSVEAYIYQKFSERFSQMSGGVGYCTAHNKANFELAEFINLFWAEAGLKRSIDKIYEIIVYSLFSAIVEALELSVELSYNPSKIPLLEEFDDFAGNILRLNTATTTFKTPAKIHRVGVTNAADRGMDMWANFGVAIQIKHLSLNEELAEDIVNTISADRIVIVCKKAEEKIILSLLNQIGWKAKIQSIITETDLINWYEKALRGVFKEEIGDNILKILNNEIKVEFPVTEKTKFQTFYTDRNYHKLLEI